MPKSVPTRLTLFFPQAFIFPPDSEFPCAFYPEFENPSLSSAGKFQPQKALCYCSTGAGSLA